LIISLTLSLRAQVLGILNLFLWVMHLSLLRSIRMILFSDWSIILPTKENAYPDMRFIVLKWSGLGWHKKHLSCLFLFFFSNLQVLVLGSCFYKLWYLFSYDFEFWCLFIFICSISPFLYLLIVSNRCSILSRSYGI
jgi:hypothetical protein